MSKIAAITKQLKQLTSDIQDFTICKLVQGSFEELLNFYETKIEEADVLPSTRTDYLENWENIKDTLENFVDLLEEASFEIEDCMNCDGRPINWHTCLSPDIKETKESRSKCLQTHLKYLKTLSDKALKITTNYDNLHDSVEEIIGNINDENNGDPEILQPFEEVASDLEDLSDTIDYLKQLISCTEQLQADYDQGNF